MLRIPVEGAGSEATCNLISNHSYHYSPLKDNELRLLELFPGTNTDAVSSHLHQYRIDECPPFEALSYTWGGEDRNEKIHVNNGNLRVTPNLHNALKELSRNPLLPLPKDSFLRLSVLLNKFKVITKQSHPPAFSGDGLQLLAKCFGEAAAEYILFSASQQDSAIASDEGQSGNVSMFSSLDGRKDRKGFGVLLCQRLERIEELWDTYLTEEGKARLLRLPRLLWIDAICINQADVEERSKQIIFMRKIYKIAKQLVVWLGAENNGSEKAITFIMDLAKRKGENESDLRQWIRDIALSPSFTETYVALGRLFARPWFRRTWIVQEYVVGSHNGTLFCCGSRRFSGMEIDFFCSMQDEFTFRNAKLAYGNEFRNLMSDGGLGEGYAFDDCGEYDTKSAETRKTSAARIFSRISTEFMHGFRAWESLTSLKVAYQVAISNGIHAKDEWLHYWLETIRRTQSTDPRDKVYATLGLIEESYGNDQSIGIEPGSLILDYNAPVQNVYSSFVRAVVERTKRLGILSACIKGAPTREDFVRRTWTPDWTQSSYDSILKMEPFKVRHGAQYGSPKIRYNHRASGDLDAVAKFSWDLNMMTVKGISWDRIAFISSRIIDESGSPFISSTFKADCMKIWEWIKLKNDAITEDEAKEKLLRALLRYEDPAIPGKWMPPLENWLDPNKIDCSESSTNMQAKDATRRANSPEHISTSSSNWRTSEFPQRVLYTIWVTRRLILTDQGHIGQGPANAEPGDVVCVILGCAVPIVLRPVEGHWEVVGEAYLHGIMQGEAITALDEERVPMQDFELH